MSPSSIHTITGALAVTFCIAASATEASAQELNLANTTVDRPNLVHVRTGLEHGFTAQLGYDRVLSVSDRMLIVGFELGMPWAEPDLGDVQLRLGASMPLVERGPWKVSARLGPTLRSADTAASRMTSIGADLRVAAGYYRRRGFVAADAGLDWAAATYIRSSDEYRMRIYADAEDGWYSSTGGTIRAGVQAGVSLTRFDVVARAGRTFAIDFDSQTVPFYATLGLNFAH